MCIPIVQVYYNLHLRHRNEDVIDCLQLVCRCACHVAMRPVTEQVPPLSFADPRSTLLESACLSADGWLPSSR